MVIWGIVWGFVKKLLIINFIYIYLVVIGKGKGKVF